MFTNKIKMDSLLALLKHAFYVVFAYLEIDIEVFIILIGFMSIDSFSGAIASVRLGNKFNFKTLIWGFCLKLCFLIIPLTVALLGKGLGQNYSLGVDIVMKVLILSEFYSFIGNIYTAKNKKKVEKIDVISMLLKSIRILLKKIIQGFLKKIETGDKCFNEKNNK